MKLTGAFAPPDEASSEPAHQAVPILVVDDNPAKRMSVKAVLAPLDYLVVEASSGADALRCLMAQDFAVILLDVQMPVMDGFETASLIRLRPRSETTPIIFITAHETDEITTYGYAQGAVDFISAPVHPVELRAKVRVFANHFVQACANTRRARELQASADQLRILAETAPIGIFQTDASNRYVYTNARWSDITGISAATAAGQMWHLLIDHEQRARLAGQFLAGMDTSEFATRFEMEVAGAGTRILLLTSKAMLDESGGITGWVGTLADITAEAGAEAAMAVARDNANAASQLKSDFLANMSHEIRTPMNGVIGLTDLLLDTELSEEQREFVETLGRSGEALMTVINGILDFAKIEGGMLEIEEIEFSVPALVEDIVDLLRPSAQSKGLRLTTVLDDSIPAVASGDPSRLRQVLTNLAGNAIKFTEAGEVVIRASAATAAEPDTILRFELSDSGTGIASDKLALIFEPFTQADTSTTRVYGGTGLGLSICNQLVTLMGGEVGVSSELGVGSTFWFTARVRALEEEPTHDPGADDAGFAGIRTLILDHHATQRATLSNYLVSWGMDVTTAYSATDALKALHAAAEDDHPIDIAFVDESPQRREGTALETALLADPVLHTRLVLITPPGRDHDLAEAGERVTVSRPIRREHVRTAVHETLALMHALPRGSATAPVAPGVPPSGRILLAEDNLINQKVAVAILTKGGYHVDTARNGREAVRASTSHHYDAILMDCHMPQMNGFEATAAIRTGDSSNRLTPIVAITAGAREEDEARCLEEGMDGYVSKPLRANILLETLGQAIDRARDSPTRQHPTETQDPAHAV